jgi:hypothetical protein
MAEAGSTERSLLRKAVSPSSACAGPLELGGLADGSLARHVATRLRDHVAGCPRCQTELTLLKEFEDAAPGPDEEGAVSWISGRLERRFSEESVGSTPSRGALPRRSWFTGLNVGGVAVAGATLAVALTIGLREGRAPELAQPSPTAPLVLRSAGITALSPAGDLEAAPDELRWEPRIDAASYSVQVMEVDHAELWRAETRDSTIALPPAVRAQIVPGKPLLWEVVAKDAAGTPVASSGKQRFRMRM